LKSGESSDARETPKDWTTTQAPEFSRTLGGASLLAAGSPGRGGWSAWKPPRRRSKGACSRSSIGVTVCMAVVRRLGARGGAASEEADAGV